MATPPKTAQNTRSPSFEHTMAGMYQACPLVRLALGAFPLHLFPQLVAGVAGVCIAQVFPPVPEKVGARVVGELCPQPQMIAAFVLSNHRRRDDQRDCWPMHPGNKALARLGRHGYRRVRGRRGQLQDPACGAECVPLRNGGWPRVHVPLRLVSQPYDHLDGVVDEGEWVR